MKARFAAPLLLFATIAIVSCKKDKSDPNDQPQNTKEDSLIVGIQQGLSLDDDTVYLISYDANKRITSIVDTTSSDTTNATYNETGDLATLTAYYDPADKDKYIFTFNANHQLTQVDYHGGSNSQEWKFEYTNGVLSKKSYLDNAEGSLSLWNYFTYEITNGNITNMKEYDKNGSLHGETSYTYTTDSNVLKTIALFNPRNRLGFDDLASIETYVNKNLMATASKGGITTTYTYTYNSNKHLSKCVVYEPDAEYPTTYTRMFSY